MYAIIRSFDELPEFLADLRAATVNPSARIETAVYDLSDDEATCVLTDRQAADVAISYPHKYAMRHTTAFAPEK
jgi:hypothetical protein